MSQKFGPSFPGVAVNVGTGDTVSFDFTLGPPDVPMPPAGVQYRIMLLRLLLPGQRGLARDWELAELKIGAGGLVLELDGHGANKRTVEPVRAPFHPSPGAWLACSVHYNATTGEIHASVGGVTLSGTTALRAGGRPISAIFGVLPGDGGPALTYPHDWLFDQGTDDATGGMLTGNGHQLNPATSGGSQTPPVPTPASSTVSLAVLLAQLLASNGHQLSDGDRAVLAALATKPA